MKLTKAQQKEQAAICKKIDDARNSFEAELSTFNEAVTEAYSGLSDALNKLNDARGMALEFAQGIRDQGQEYTDSKSEKWADSENGEAHKSWTDEWSEVADALDTELEVDEPEEVCTPDMDALESFAILQR